MRARGRGGSHRHIQEVPRVCFDLSGRVLNATGKEELSEGQAALLTAVFCHADWTTSRASASGYSIENCCPMCGLAGDALVRRLCRCQSREAVALRMNSYPSHF
eukprot:6549886-Pyramimonas_sp.AAC.1